MRITLVIFKRVLERMFDAGVTAHEINAAPVAVARSKALLIEDCLSKLKSKKYLE